MYDVNWQQKQAQMTLQRLRPQLGSIVADESDGALFHERLETHFERLLTLLHSLYGSRDDFSHHVQQIILAAARAFKDRPADLKTLDRKREDDPLWFQSETNVGAVCYVDLFAGTLNGLKKQIPYLQQLGITYLHLMPLFKMPDDENDGGYAVSDYRTVDARLGKMKDLVSLAREFRKHGISLVLDFVFNHTSDEHEWAKKAAAGDPEYANYYYLFDDRTLPNAYSHHLREIFPEQDPGCFTYREDIRKWVWTTFRSFQWDLNYSNPAVFRAMMEEMLFLANQGVEVLRLDAVAFIWKQMGTSCENLPQAHTIIQAFNALVRIVAPAMLFKSEAIVHPADVSAYINWDECPISYNPTLMALLWESVATREVKLLRNSMSRRFELSSDCAWVNYVRVHDDIGWTFADEDASEVGIDGFNHRQFLNRYYTGQFGGSFARGLAFNYNPTNQDMRISGTAASLVGIEQALELDDDGLLDSAIRRLLLIYSVVISAGGIPLLYLGDEIAMLNDYSYRENPAIANDSRWAHRPAFDWDKAASREDVNTVEGVVFQGLRYLLMTRKLNPVFANGDTLFFDTFNPHVLGYVRDKRMLVLANFSEQAQTVRRAVLIAYTRLPDSTLDLVTNQMVDTGNDLVLEPYQFMWLHYGHNQNGKS